MIEKHIRDLRIFHLSTSRDSWIEGLRVLSAFGIVSFHSDPNRFNYSSLSSFIALTAYNAVRSASPFDPTKIAFRFLMPWAIWSFVYASLDTIARRAALPHDAASAITYALRGPSPHLWFMPFAAVSVVSIRWAVARTSLGFVSSFGALAGFMWLLCVPLWRPWSMTLVEPLPQFAHALAPLAFGTVVAGIAGGELSTAILAAVLLAEMGLLALLPFYGLGDTYAMGCAAMAAAVGLAALSPLRVGWINRVAELTLGIYLVHPLFISLMHHVIGRASPLVVTIGAFCLSMAATAALQKVTPLRRFVWSTR